jgi:hypothetical protein
VQGFNQPIFVQTSFQQNQVPFPFNYIAPIIFA